MRWSGEAGATVIKRACELASAHVSRPDGTPVRWTVDAWANVSGPGAFNMPHVHGGTYWAAVYYVRVGEGDGGQLVLHDPRMPGLRMHAPGIRFSNMGPDVRAEIKPKEGLLVMFPGWLSHSVEPWLGSGEKISVAMNIRALAEWGPLRLRHVRPGGVDQDIAQPRQPRAVADHQVAGSEILAMRGKIRAAA